jgi:flagellar biosynthesis protein FlhB
VAGSEEPTPRRRALARRAGVVPASAAWAAAGAWAGAAIAIVAAGGAAAGALAAWASDAASRAPAAGAVARAGSVSFADVLAVTARLAAPIVVAAALAALVAHGALVRGAWVPRRRVRGAPVVARDLGRRAGDALFAAARGAIVLAVAMRFAAVHLGDAVHVGGCASGDPAGAGRAAAALVGAGLAHVAVAVALVGALDALERARRWRGDLRMTPRERKDEDRESRGDPRWRDARRRRARERPAAAAIREAAVAITGDRVAVAVQWHPHLHPIPSVIARGRGALAAQLVALARRT